MPADPNELFSPLSRRVRTAPVRRTAVQGIVFGANSRPTIGVQPENVLNTGFVRGLDTGAPVVGGPRRAAELYEQRRASGGGNLALADQREEARRAKLVADLVLTRVKTETDARKTLAGAALAERLASIAVDDPEFAVKTAKAYTEFADGADTEVAKAVREMQKNDRQLYMTAQTRYDDEVFKATAGKRIAAVSESDAVPSELKTALVRPDGSIDAAALSQAEAAMKGGGGQAAKSFYDGLTKEYGLTRSDLDLIDTKTPGAVQYQDARGGVVSAEDVRGGETTSFAVGSAGKKSFRIQLDKFNQAMQTHANLRSATPPVAAAATPPSAAALQEEADRRIREASNAFNGVPPRPGVAAVAAARVDTTATKKIDPLTLLRSKLGTAADPTKSPAPVASANPVDSLAAPTPSDQESQRRASTTGAQSVQF